MPKLRVGFIVDAKGVSSYVHDLIQVIMENSDLFGEAALIVQKPPAYLSGSKQRFLDKIPRKPSAVFRYFISQLINRIELRVVRKTRHHADYTKTIELNDIQLEKVHVDCIPSKSRVIYRYAADSIAQLQEMRFDVLVRCGKGILKGDILNVAKFGVLSFHHGDNRVNRGLPSGFWEVYLNEPSSGFVIQQLTDELDGGSVLHRGNIMTQNYWRLNNALLLKKSNVFMAKLLTSLAEQGQLPQAEARQPYSKQLFRSPSAAALSVYLIRISSKLLRESFQQRILKLRKRWGVAYLRGDGLGSVMYRARIIPNPPSRFLADPFVFKAKNQTVCFVEDYFDEHGIAKISAYELTDDGHKALGVVLEEDFHLSFPFIFEYRNELFMCPETSQKQEIRLYKCVDFPLKWLFHKTLISDVSAADTMIFERDGLWYMLTNICSANIYDHHSELHLYTANNPLSEKWRPCSSNPVIFDSRKARNGGYFFVGKNLYRVNQVQGKAFYGKSAQVNLVEFLDENIYREKLVCDIEPGFFPGIRGTHHYHSNGEWCVFDFLKLERT